MELVGQSSSFQWVREISNTPAIRQIGFMLGLSASIALGLSLVFWSQSEDYVPLYMDLDMQSSSEVVEVLERNNTPFRMDRMSGTIQVPSDQLHRLRMQLAAEGLPSSNSGSGFDMLKEDPKLGISGFMEKARYDHALEQELAKTISTIANVRAARVHLAVPKASGFIRKSGRPAASVLVNLYNGRELSKRQVAGITHLVAASVPEMLSDDVSVVDQEGRLLSDSSGMGLGAGIEQLEMVRSIEQGYMDRILEILVPIAGRGGVRAQVNADMDFTSFESTSETYSPDKALRSEQVEQAENESRKANGGVPGTLSNQPPDNPNVNQAAVGIGRLQPADKSSNSKAIRNYELDKTISHQKQATGVLKRLTVAVVLDHHRSFDAEGEPVKQPYTKDEIDQIKELVQEAVGFDQKRGDRVTVKNAPFVEFDQVEEIAEPSLLEAPWVWQAARVGVALIICMILVFAVIRPVMKSAVPVKTIAQTEPSLSPPAESSDKALPPGAEDSGLNIPASQSADEPEADAGAEEGSEQLALESKEPAMLVHQQDVPLYRHQLDAARDLVEQQPETVAHVVKHWVSKDLEE